MRNGYRGLHRGPRDWKKVDETRRQARDLIAPQEPKMTGLERGTMHVVASDDKWPAVVTHEYHCLCKRVRLSRAWNGFRQAFGD